MILGEIKKAELSSMISVSWKGNIFSWLEQQASRAGAKAIEGIFVRRERNHQMYLLYAMSGFRPYRANGSKSVLFARKCEAALKKPEWLTIQEQV